MATRELKLAAIYSEGKRLEFMSGTSWTRIPGFLDWTISGAERDSRSTGTDSDRPHGVVSSLKAPTVDCTFNFVPSPVWDTLDAALIDKRVMTFRMTTEGEVIKEAVAGNTQAAIAATGAVTFELSSASAPTIDELPLGSDIVIGSTHYPIVSVPDTEAGLATLRSAGTGVMVSPISSAVSDSDYTIETPSTSVTFRGKVTITPTRQHTLAQQSEREGSLMIQSLSVIPAPVRVV